jgi:hypothetical protein
MGKRFNKDVYICKNFIRISEEFPSITTQEMHFVIETMEIFGPAQTQIKMNSIKYTTIKL